MLITGECHDFNISFLWRVVASAIWPCSSVLGWKRSLLGWHRIKAANYQCLHPQIRMLNGIGLVNCTKFATFLLALDHIDWYDCPSGPSSWIYPIPIYLFRSISAIWLRLKHEKATARTNIAKRPDLRKNKIWFLNHNDFSCFQRPCKDQNTSKY